MLDYPETLARIEAVWPTSDVGHFIANCVFLTDGTVCEEPFDLAAFDDLLLLLAISQTTAPADRGTLAARRRTTPLAGEDGGWAAGASGAAAGAMAAMPDIDMLPDLSFDAPLGDMPATPRRPPAPPPGLVVDSFDLDLDLSEPTPGGAGEVPTAPVALPNPSAPPVGFGSSSDRFEVSFELEELEKKRGKPE
ncbi:hypothetical protein Acidovoranil_08550 [Acidovorax sp. FG27]